ncbi:unnamed protein product [Boreogadus saida]
MGEVVTEEDEEEEELGDPMSPLSHCDPTFCKLKSGQFEQGRPGQACHCDGLPFWTTAQCYDALDMAPRGQGSVVEGKAQATCERMGHALVFSTRSSSSSFLHVARGLLTLASWVLLSPVGYKAPVTHLPPVPPSPTLASRPHVHTLSPSEAHGAFAHSALKYRPS